MFCYILFDREIAKDGTEMAEEAVEEPKADVKSAYSIVTIWTMFKCCMFKCCNL